MLLSLLQHKHAHTQKMEIQIITYMSIVGLFWKLMGMSTDSL